MSDANQYPYKKPFITIKSEAERLEIYQKMLVELNAVYDDFMKILIACEFSGVTRRAFARLGHDAWSCDLRETEIPGQHIVGNVKDQLSKSWDMIIASPPIIDVELALTIWNADCPKIAIDNPPSVLSRYIGKPTQTLNPWMFGLSYISVSGLWLKGLPSLHADQTKMRGKVLAKVQKPLGIDALKMSPVVANAMAKAWG